MSKQEKMGLVPELRFLEFRDAGEWKRKPFSKLFEIGSGKDYKHLSSGDIPVYGSGGYMLSVDDYLYDGESACIGRKGTINNPIFLTGKFWTVDTLFYTHSFKNCLPKFIFLIFESINWLKHNEAGGVPSLSKVIINKIESYIPPEIEEQKKIIDCFASINDSITTQTQKLEALKAHKKGLMQQLFPAEGESVPKLRFPEFRDAGEWKEFSIESLIKEEILFAPKDGNHGNIHPKASDYVSHGIPFIMANDIKAGEINLSDCSHISKAQADSLQKGFAQEEDVLFTHKGTVGEVAIINQIEFPYLMLTPQVTYYRVKNKDRLINRFLAHSFISERFKCILKRVSGGGTRAYIGITEQRKLSVTLPPSIHEQCKITDFLSTIDSLIKANEHFLIFLKTHKKGLLQKLFPAVDEASA